MRRRVGSFEASMIAAALIASFVAAAGVGAASDPVRKCREAVLRGAAKLAHARLTALRKCEDAKRAEKLPAVAVCREQADVVRTFTTATDHLDAAIERACGGDDKRCGGTDDVSLAAMGWPSTCPELEGSACARALADCRDVSPCLACLADAAVSRDLALVYAPLALVDAKTARTVAGCQKALAAAAATLADAHLAIEARCLAGRLAQKHDGSCPLPGDGTAATKLTAARAKAETKACKACGGADKRCGGEPDIALALVGTTPACPGIGTCAPTIASVADLVGCFDCTAGVRAECALAAAASGVAEYPAGCAVAAPTPTPTVTPLPSETPVASPTLSATPTPTPPPIFCPAADAGHATTTLTIRIETGGTLLGGVSPLLIDYAPHLVRLPGVLDDPEVRARVVDLTGGALVNRAAPNNQDTDGDREPDRLRFSIVTPDGFTGSLLSVTFDRCAGARLTTVADYVCTLGRAFDVDGLKTVPATCSLALTQGQP